MRENYPEVQYIFISEYKPDRCTMEWTINPPVEKTDELVYSFITNMKSKSHYDVTIPATIEKLSFDGLMPRTQCEFKIRTKEGKDQKTFKFVTPTF